MTESAPKWLHVDRMLQLADELTEMHAGLSGLPELFQAYSLDRLLTGAEYLRQAHKFITSTPAVVQRARLAALLEGYTSATKIVRAFAEDLRREGIVVPAPKALESLAAILDNSMAEYRGAADASAKWPKPKLIVN